MCHTLGTYSDDIDTVGTYFVALLLGTVSKPVYVFISLDVKIHKY